MQLTSTRLADLGTDCFRQCAALLCSTHFEAGLWPHCPPFIPRLDALHHVHILLIVRIMPMIKQGLVTLAFTSYVLPIALIAGDQVHVCHAPTQGYAKSQAVWICSVVCMLSAVAQAAL